MSLNRMFHAAVVTLVVAAGCTEENVTGVPAADAVEPADLDLVVPALTRETLMHGETVHVEPPSAPARALGDDPTGSEEPEGPDYTRSGQIFSPTTTVGFTSTYAYSTGRHSYTGNIGRVTTEATLTFDGQVIGRQPKERQDAVPYLLDFGRIKQIWVEAYIFIDQDCGLTVDGDSRHEAWWQWFLGSGAPGWGKATMTSQAFPPVSQPECGQLEPDPFTGGGDGGGGGGGWVTCWWWVTYDPSTGEILEADLLYCEDVIGG